MPVVRERKEKENRFLEEDTRSSRESQEHTDVSDMRENNEYDAWFGPTGDLRSPPPRKGFEQRWVRFEYSNGTSDPSNYQRKSYQFKWTPRKADTLPDSLQLFSDEQKVDGTIKVRGMILCERPIEVGNAHRRWLAEQNKAQKMRVKNDLNRSAYLEKGMQPRVLEDYSRSYRGTAVASDE